MKLYLSSYRIPSLDDFIKFVGKSANEIRMGMVLNSKDYRDPEYRKSRGEESMKYFRNLGFIVEEIDLRDYYDNKDIYKKCKEIDVIWFKGGNTFMLREALSKSGLDECIKELMSEGLIYAGDSAGAIVAGPTLKHFDEMDDLTKVSSPIYDGLSLINFSIIPHWENKDFPDSVLVKEGLDNDGIENMTLTDDEYITMVGDKISKS